VSSSSILAGDALDACPMEQLPGSSITYRTALPQRTQLPTSMPKTRFSRLAHVMAACRSMAERSGRAAPFPRFRPLPDGVTSARQR
jgi:hypothetical protein